MEYILVQIVNNVPVFESISYSNLKIRVEAASRFELENGGFADLCLTTWLCRHKKMERETGFEPATSTLARSHSTTELFPLDKVP